MHLLTQKLKKSICAIRSVLKNFAEFYFCHWLLLLLDFHYRLTPDSFSKELIFVKNLQHIFWNFREEYSVISQKLRLKNWNKCLGYPKSNFSPLNIFAKSSIIDVILGSQYATKLSIKYFFPIITINPRTFWIKKQMFSLMSKFFVYIEIIPELKNVGRREVVKNSKKIGRQSSKLVYLLKRFYKQP